MHPTFSTSLRHAARNWPDKPAIRAGEAQITYAALDLCVDRLVATMRSRGLERGDRVAVLLHNCPEYLVVAAATARAGLVMVPVNYRLASPEIAYVLKDCGASRVIFSAQYLQTLAGALPDVPGLGRSDCWLVGGDGTDGWGACPAASASDPPPAVVLPDADLTWDDDFLIIYTSGTTGKPKGAVLTHGSRMLWIHSMALEYEIRRSDLFLAVMPMNHSAGITFAMAHLHAGGTVVIHERFDLNAVLNSLQADRVSTALFVPTMIHRLMEAGADLGALRTVVSTGSVVPAPVKARLMETWRVRLFDYYGATESPNMTTLRPEDQLRKAGSVGQPFYNVEIRIVGDQGEDLSPGTVGEIWVRNASLMKGYHNRPDATSAVLRDGWYTTGDLGYLDEERFLFLAGRKREVIVSGGSNIYPAEVEAVLAEHPAVQDAAVIGVPDPEWGETPMAVVVLHEGQHAAAEELIAHCRERLAGYKRPRHLVFAVELPRNAGGKVMKQLLVQQYGQAKGRIGT